MDPVGGVEFSFKILYNRDAKYDTLIITIIQLSSKIYNRIHTILIVKSVNARSKKLSRGLFILKDLKGKQ